MTVHVRSPLPVRAAAALVLLLAVVTTGGAVYLTFADDARPTTGSLAFFVVCVAIKTTAVALAFGLLRGSRPAWYGLLGYALGWEVSFSLVSLIGYGETAALLIGGTALFVIVPLLLSPTTRRHVQLDRDHAGAHHG